MTDSPLTKDKLRKSLYLSTGMNGKIELKEAIRLFELYEASAVRLLREKVSELPCVTSTEIHKVTGECRVKYSDVRKIIDEVFGGCEKGKRRKEADLVGWGERKADSTVSELSDATPVVANPSPSQEPPNNSGKVGK